MNRFFSLLLFVILLVNSAGFYVYYAAELTSIRIEMRAALKTLSPDQLDVIKMSANAFAEARVEEHEIKVAGKMYDIGWVERSGNVVTVYCKHDEKEDNLMALLDHVLGVPIQDRAAFPSVVTEFINLCFITPGFRIHLQANVRTLVPATAYNFSVKTYSFTPGTQPPRLF